MQTSDPNEACGFRVHWRLSHSEIAFSASAPHPEEPALAGDSLERERLTGLDSNLSMETKQRFQEETASWLSRLYQSRRGRGTVEKTA